MKVVVTRKTKSISELELIFQVKMTDDEYLKLQGKYIYVPSMNNEYYATMPTAIRFECDRDIADVIERTMVEELRDAYNKLLSVIAEDEQYIKEYPI